MTHDKLALHLLKFLDMHLLDRLHLHCACDDSKSTEQKYIDVREVLDALVTEHEQLVMNATARELKLCFN